MDKGYFVKEPQHPGLVALLHYSAVRISEGLRTEKEQFRLTKDVLYYDVGERLKGSFKTDPLPIPLEAPYVDRIVESIEKTKPGKRVFPYCRKTGYNVVHRVFKYPHYHRLTRITWFFQHGYNIVQVRSWTGLSLSALEYYVGLLALSDMGKSLGK
jgi:integrase